MDSAILTIGDLKNGKNKTWNYPRLQLNLTDEDASMISHCIRTLIFISNSQAGK